MLENEIKVSVGEIFLGTFDALRSSPIPYLVYAFGMAILGTIAELASSVSYAGYFVISLVAGLALLRFLLAAEAMPGSRSFGSSFISYLGSAILVGLAAFFGLILLIVPGVILLARWSITSGIVVADDAKAIDAMQRSWALTRASQWSIVVAYLVFGLAVLFIAILVGGGVGAFDGFDLTSVADAPEENTPAKLSLFTNFSINLGTELVTVFSTAMVVFLTKRLAGASNQLEGVFS